MNKRTIDEMIAHINQEVSNMDIAQEYKMALLGMITAIGYESKKQDVAHGEWVGVHEYIDHLEKVTGEKFQISNLYDGCNFCNNCWYSFPRKYNYCPNCGAKMDGKENENEQH